MLSVVTKEKVSCLRDFFEHLLKKNYSFSDLSQSSEGMYSFSVIWLVFFFSLTTYLYLHLLKTLEDNSFYPFKKQSQSISLIDKYNENFLFGILPL